MSKFMLIALAVVCWLSLPITEIAGPGGALQTKSQVLPQSWSPARYLGIEVGKSSRWAVIQAFGFPQREDFKDDPASETWYIYEKGGAFPGQFMVAVDKKSETVSAMFLEPSHLSSKQVIEQFGKNYVLTRYESCPGYDDAESGPIYESPKGRATYIEYRSLGIAILVDQKSSVIDIRYLKEPIGFSSRSECPKSDANTQ